MSRRLLERRQMINALGPVWDGNEVWMITAGGALFASFPHVYATFVQWFLLGVILDACSAYHAWRSIRVPFQEP